jgi:thioredoxin-related protein
VRTAEPFKEKTMITYRLPLLVIAVTMVAALVFGVLARSVRADEGIWQTDFKAAMAKAKTDKKYMLVDFTGSDWCGWCIKLHNEVFDKEPFKATAPKQYVLVELDYPQQKKQSDELKKQNAELSEKYKIEGYPSVLLMDADGQVIARTGYRPGGPEGYLKHLSDFGTIWQEVLGLKGKLEGISGLDRAKLLDQIVDDYKKLGNENDDVTGWCKEIIALDADNKAGLKVKYEFPMKVQEAEKLVQSGKMAEGLAMLDTALALTGVPGEMRQEGFMAKAEILESQGKFADVMATLKSAKEAAPASQMSKQIDGMIEHFTKIAEAEEAAKKLEAELANAQGLDRARLLDKLITAKEKLPESPQAAEAVQKWTKEIVELDADNKAGLKPKYQFNLALSSALDLARNGKTDDAGPAIDKALAIAGVGGEELQKGYFFKAQLAGQNHRLDEELSCLKNALDAAPKSEIAPMIKQMIGQVEKAKGG